MVQVSEYRIAVVLLASFGTNSKWYVRKGIIPSGRFIHRGYINYTSWKFSRKAAINQFQAVHWCEDRQFHAISNLPPDKYANSVDAVHMSTTIKVKSDVINSQGPAHYS